MTSSTKTSSIKIVFSALALCTAVLPAAAVDFGAMLNNNTKFAGNTIQNMTLEQKNAFTAWINVPFNNEGTMYFAAEGIAQYKNTDGTSLVTADCDLFKFNSLTKFSNKSKLLISAGRFYYSDGSGLVFDQTSDGLLAQLKLSSVNLGVYGGYTGLLNAQNVTILNSKTTTYSYDTTSVYALAAPYAVFGVTGSLPYLFANQTLGAEFYGVLGASDMTSGYNRFYGTLSLNGPLASSVFYSLTSTFATADSFSTLSNLSQAMLSWYPSFKSMAVSLGGIYASGSNGPFSPFVGVTSNTAVQSFTQPEYSGLIKATLSASIKPITTLLLAVGGDGVFDCAESDIGYYGFQAYGSVRYDLFSDVQLGLTANQFIGNDSATSKTTIIAKAVISF